MSTWHDTALPHQIEGRERIIDSDPGLLLFWDPGLRKTSTMLSAFCDMPPDWTMLVVAPKRVALTVWPVEIKKWGFDLSCSVIVGTAAECKKAADRSARVYVTNVERLMWLLNHWDGWMPNVLVVDESTKLKAGRRSKRFKALLKVLGKFDRRYCLTGTPAPNSLEDLWAQAYIVDLGEALEAKYITHFRNRFFYPSGEGYRDWKIRPGAEELIYKLLAPIVSRLDKLDHLDLPPLLVADIPVELPPDARKTYAELEKHFVAELEAGEVSAVSAAVAVNKLRQIANGRVYDEDHKVHDIHTAKQEALAGLLEQIHEPVIIVYEFQHDIEVICKALPEGSISAVIGGGRTKDSQIQGVVDQWNSVNIDYLIVNHASAGHGLNLQEGGHHVIWYGLTWNLEGYDQTIARLWRSGQKHNVIVHRLIATDTIDEDVSAKLEKKGATQKDLLDALKRRQG